MKNVNTETTFKRGNGNKKLYVSADWHQDGIERVGTFKAWKKFFNVQRIQDGVGANQSIALYWGW